MAKAYVHAGMVALDGDNMSKSKGNLVFVSRLRGDGVDPMAVRLGLLSGHYRADRDWTDDVLKAGEERLARWRAAAVAPVGPSGEGLLAAVRESLADDLDAPAALTIVDAWADAALSAVGDDEAAPALMSRVVDSLLGVRL
jgi:L-cysteine:1D-myo-inositol 2-amino-2-deoxy-alpha-D-glucopyranoside ligase